VTLRTKSVHSLISDVTLLCLGVCHLEPAMGPCRASLIRWRYNATSERCVTFIYGGCLGNENNFSDEMSCLYFCTGQLLAKPPKGDNQ